MSKLYPGHTLVLNPGTPNACLCAPYIFAVPWCTQSRGRAWADHCLHGWRCRAALRDSASSIKEYPVCPGSPFYKRNTETVLLFFFLRAVERLGEATLLSI